MKAQILKIQMQVSKYGGYFYYVFLKGEDGKSYKTCISESCRNFKNWKNFLEEGIMLGGLKLKGRGLIDADSQVFRVN